MFALERVTKIILLRGQPRTQFTAVRVLQEERMILHVEQLAQEVKCPVKVT